MLLDQYDAVISKTKTCKVYKNGNPDKFQPVVVKLQPGLKIMSFQEILQRCWQIPMSRVRLYNSDGVELFDEDLVFLKDNCKLFASNGDEFDTNTTYSEYQIIRQLGEGGFGKVLLAQHKSTRQQVAIKIVNTQMIGNAQDIDMVFREAELLKSLDHQNIVKILSCYTLSNMQVVFIMEYLEGGELLEYLDGMIAFFNNSEQIEGPQLRKKPEYSSSRWLKQCNTATRENQYIVTSNLRISYSQTKINDQQQLHSIDEVKIVDFGIAGLAMHLNVEKINVGSLRYMAPETLNGVSKQIGPQLDIWAMGVILFTLVTSVFPFKGSTSQETIRLITSVQYQFPSQCPLSNEFKDLISRIFISDPSKRIKLKEILDHQWVRQLRTQDPYVTHTMDRYLVINQSAQKKLRVTNHANLAVPVGSAGSQATQRKRSRQDDDEDEELLIAEVLQIPIVKETPKLNIKLKRAPQLQATKPMYSFQNLGTSPLLLKTTRPQRGVRHMKTDQESIFTLPKITDVPQPIYENVRVMDLPSVRNRSEHRYLGEQVEFTNRLQADFQRRSSKVVASLGSLNHPQVNPFKTPRPSPRRKF